MQSLSFDGLSSHYDETRTFDPVCFKSALDWIHNRFPPAEYSTILEPGIGSGRIAIPLAKLDYRVVGADISRQMLNLCAAYSLENGLKDRVNCVQADTTRLPFADGSFDLAIAVHLFYFTR